MPVITLIIMLGRWNVSHLKPHILQFYLIPWFFSTYVSLINSKRIKLNQENAAKTCNRTLFFWRCRNWSSFDGTKYGKAHWYVDPDLPRGLRRFWQWCHLPVRPLKTRIHIAGGYMKFFNNRFPNRLISKSSDFCGLPDPPTRTP